MTTNSADPMSESSFSESCVCDSHRSDSFVLHPSTSGPTSGQLPQPPPLPPVCNSDQDTIVRASAPPVTIVEASSQEVSASTLRITTFEGKHGKGESASWLGSLMVHGLLIALLALFLAPVDFGGDGIQELYIRFTNKEAGSLPTVAILDVSQDEPDLPPNDPLPPIVEPKAASLEGELARNENPASTVPSGSGIAGGGGTISNNNGSRGSFFGIDAHGHEFVYVLDMSGSMRGRRFSRATAELIRSVGELRKSQSFYVLMFNGSTVQMFDEKNLRPKSLAATAENKERLAMWLKSAFRGGSTDPRGALKIALQMNPSAIFMLSDGEFDETTQQREGLVGSKSDTFSIVNASFSEAPIHAIAFEDPKSCDNMKRLAVMTGGKYRFTAASEEASGKEALVAARNSLERGDIATAEILMHELVVSFGHTEAGWQARKELGTMLFESSQNALKKGDLEIAKEGLIRLVELDPDALVTQDIQTSLVKSLLDQKRASVSGEINEVTLALMKVAERFPNSKIATEIAEPIAEELLEHAKRLSADGDTADSIAVLEEVGSAYPKTVAAQRSQVMLEEMRERAMSRARDIRKSKGNVEYIQYLRQLTKTYDDTLLGRIALRSLEEEAMNLLVQVRDANTNRDSETRQQIEKQLEEGFEEASVLHRVRQELAQKEFKGRDLFRRGTRYEKSRGVEQAITTYEKIVSKYAGTIAAKKAKDRLRQLIQKSSDRIEDSSAEEALRIMMRQAE